MQEKWRVKFRRNKLRKNSRDVPYSVYLHIQVISALQRIQSLTLR